METKNISELIEKADNFADYTDAFDDLKKIEKGEYNVYGYCFIGKYADCPAHDEVSLLGKCVNDIEKAISLAWWNAGLGRESEQWTHLPNYGYIIVTDSKGMIIKETPRRYY